MILVLSKILFYFENNSVLMKYKRAIQLVVSTIKTNKHNECKCIYRKNVIHFQKQLVPTDVSFALAFYL